MKIIEYHVVTETDKAMFIEAVQARIDEGYQPLGGVAIQESYAPKIDEFFPMYAQAVVKYGDGK